MNATLSFPESSQTDFDLVTFELRETMSELFDLTLVVQSRNAHVEISSLIGQRVALHLGGRNHLQEVRGIVRAVKVISTETTGVSRYTLTVVPPLWLTTRRTNHRIFQNRSVPQIVGDVLDDYGSRIEKPQQRLGAYPVREYCSQYGETDHDFISRILADEGITSFFDHAAQSRWVLTDDTTSRTPQIEEPVPYVEPAVGNPPPEKRAILYVVITGKIKTSAYAVRDYDHQNPKFIIKARSTEDGAELFLDENDLEGYSFDVGSVRTTDQAKERSRRMLDAARVPGRRFEMMPNFAAGAGTRMTVTDHPRSDVNVAVLITRTVVLGQPELTTHHFECIEAETPFRPRRVPHPNIIGTQTAFVVPTEKGTEIDVDSLGQVKVEFRWDRRDLGVNTSRYVRVSQAWAGRKYGFVCLPRVDDEVIVEFLDGDPDQPIIIGRLHNAVNVPPLDLPAQKTISVWRSRSSPGGDGYNEILLDDKAGDERLDLRAQHDYHRLVLHDSTVTVKHDDFLTVEYNKTDWIKRAYSMTAGSITLSTGPYLLTASTVKQLAKESVYIKAGDYIMLECGASSIQIFPGNILIKSPMIEVDGGAHLLMHAGKIDLNP
jgi:type VI secretion system secreted protein VgrG